MSLEGEYEPLIGVDLTGYQYFDINYAQLRWEKALQDAKIPYDKSFDSGMEFLAGCEYHRVGKGGKSTVTELCDAHIGMVAISDVEKAFKDGTLEQFLEAEQDKQPMEWHQQAAILSD